MVTPARRFGLFVLLLTLGASSLLVSAASAPRKRSPRLVLLYATCTLNRDYLGPYNSDIGFTPNLDRFAREGVVFRRHRTEAGLSGVAYASLFSGNPALLHGVFSHPQSLPAEVYTVSEAFEENGYRTFFWGGQSMASADLGYGQGIPRDRVFDRRLRHDDTEFERLLDRLRRKKRARAFVLTNFTVTHGPYRKIFLEDFCTEAPDECRLLDRLGPDVVQRLYDLHRKHYIPLQYNFDSVVEKLQLSAKEIEDLSAVLELLYRSNVHYLDQQFGALLEVIREHGLLDESLIVFTADHGETLRRPGALFNWSHGHTVRSDVLNVPLIVRAPQLFEPKAVEGITRSIDVFPTLASLVGLKLPRDARISGRDLTALLRADKTKPGELRAFSHSAMLPNLMADLPDSKIGVLRRYYPNSDIALSWVGIRERDTVWKYRRDADGQWSMSAFDLAHDAGEIRDVFDPDQPEHSAALRDAIEYKEDLVRAYGFWKSRSPADGETTLEEELEKLRSLGYVD